MTGAQTPDNTSPAEAGPNHSGAQAAEHFAVKKPFWMKIFAHDLSAPLLLLALSLILFVPGQWTVPPLDRDEPRFTQASKQMLETGDYIDIRYQEEARHKKPVGIYWLQVAAVKLTGHDASAPLWVYRLPSLVSAILVVLLTYWFARAFTGPPAALLAALFAAAAIIVGVEGRLGKTDAALFASILLAQGALARIWLAKVEGKRFGLGCIFWSALGLGVLIKGPVAPMIIGLTVIALMILDRNARWFTKSYPLIGFLWFLAIALPWFIAITVATDGAFFQEAIGKDLLGKVGEGQEGHGAPPLTHLAVMFAIFWPLPAFALLSVSTIWRERTTPLVRYCAAWFFPSWVVFELVATKLPHYTMPLLPALLLPVAAALMDGAGTAPGRPQGARLKWGAMVLLVLPPAVLTLATLGGPAYLGDWPSPPGVVITALAAALAVVAAGKIRKDAALGAVPPAIGAAVLVAIGFWGFVGPALQTIWVSPRLTAAIAENAPCAAPRVASSGFNEPSFVFLEGTATKLIGPTANAEFLASAKQAGECAVSVVESRDETRFLDHAKEIGLVPVLLDRVQGLNINGGDRLDIGLYSNERRSDPGVEAPVDEGLPAGS